MREGYGIRKVYVGTPGNPTREYTGEHPSVRELAEEMADQCMGFFGGVEPQEGDVGRLASHLVKSAVEWVNDVYELGLK